MKPTKTLLALAGVAALVAAAAWWQIRRPAADAALTLYGNVDLRQARIPFNGSERIAEILVEEGHEVRQGQVLARLDTSRLLPQMRQAEAAVAVRQAALDRLRNGSRPEEIAQARANLASARADADNASTQYQRKRALAARAVASQQDADAAKASAEVAGAKVAVQRNALSLAVIGPRTEDISEAQARMQGDLAQLDLLRAQLNDAELRAPFDAVVRSRLMEPGEMASPTKPVLALAGLGTKWVRAYVAEPDLVRLSPGQAAEIRVDGLAGKILDGWVGFISSVAEFTPKSVQTEDLRTSLVFETRVFVTDPDNLLRLGMPATVTILPATRPQTRSAAPQP